MSPKRKSTPHPFLLKKKTNSLRGRKRIRQTKTLQGLGLHSVFLQQQKKEKKSKTEGEEEDKESTERRNDWDVNFQIKKNYV
jgi:hypothetical protein